MRGARCGVRGAGPRLGAAARHLGSEHLGSEHLGGEQSHYLLGLTCSVLLAPDYWLLATDY